MIGGTGNSLLHLDEVFSPLLGAIPVLLEVLPFVLVSFASHSIVKPPDTATRVSAQAVARRKGGGMEAVEVGLG